MKPQAAQIVLDELIYAIDKPYSYLVPTALADRVCPGIRVTVPFGKGNRKRQGLVLALTEPPAETTLKPIAEVIDETPLLDAEALDLVRYLKETTFCTWFDAVKAVLPYGICYRFVETYALCEGADLAVLTGEELLVASIASRFPDGIAKKKLLDQAGLTEDSQVIASLVKKGIFTRIDLAVRNTGDASVKMVRPTQAAEDLSSVSLTPKQKTAMSVLSDAGCCSIKELCYFTGVGPTVVNGLAKKGLVEIFEQTYYRSPHLENDCKTEAPTLTPCQENAFVTLSKLMNADQPAAALLFGVTGSGKTQVFMKLCEKALGEGKGVILMVPEIALTPQTVKKFCSLFGDQVAVFHSAMSQGQRLDEWKRVKEGKAKIAVGTRSAVLAPVRNLGLIIMDEEQEHTYKSEQSPRFHAREVAKFRAAKTNSLFLMASATPSIQTYYAALSGRYTLCTLTERYGTAVLPTVNTVDMREELQKGTGALGRELTERIADTLEENHQVILLLNRRGRDTYVSCAACGEVVTCENCSIAMTYHSANNRLMCHYCGKSVPYLTKCPSCGSDHLRYSGWGTQKVEEELTDRFPNARILRMDSDSTMTRDAYEKGLTAFAGGDYDILLGTQMVAKGLDFPNVTLVGVVNADGAIYSTDYRAMERTFSLLTQVVGRSGRGTDPGTALVQTAFPDNPVIALAANQDYPAFFEQEILTRKLMIYPPFCDLAQVVIQGPEKENAAETAHAVLEKLKTYSETTHAEVKLIALGPTAAAIPKMNGRYRYRILVKFHNGRAARKMFGELLSEFSSGSRRGATVSVDIDPESVL